MRLASDMANGIRDAGVALGHGVRDLFYVIKTSYGKGIRRAYNQTGGNDAFNLDVNPPTPADFHWLESGLHYTLSFAWLWGVLGSFIVNNVKSMKDAAVDLTNLALDEEDKVNISTQDDRPIPVRIFGGIGSIVGAIAGIVGGVAVAAGRVVTNSYGSFKYVAGSMTRAALADEDKDTIPEPVKTNLIRKFTVGFPGAVVGAIAGAVGGVAVAAGRVATNSYETFKLVAGTMTNKVLADDNQIPMTEDTRHPARKYGVGLPGAILGAVAGVVSGFAVAAGRVATNSYESFKLVAGSAINLTLPEAREISMNDDNRSNARKFGAGAPGVALGAISAVVVGAPVFVVRKVIPTVFAVGLSPLVAIWRGGRELYKWGKDKFRFSQEVSEEKQSMFQGLKNLYSSLTAMGKLPEGERVEQAPEGPYSTYGALRSAGKFFRKIVTFNTQSPTERTLGNVMEELSQAEAPTAPLMTSGGETAVAGIDISCAVDRAIERTKAYYDEPRGNSINIEIEKIADFIRLYLLAHANGRVAQAAEIRDAVPVDNSEKVPTGIYAGLFSRASRQQTPVVDGMVVNPGNDEQRFALYNR